MQVTEDMVRAAVREIARIRTDWSTRRSEEEYARAILEAALLVAPAAPLIRRDLVDTSDPEDMT